MPEGRVVPDLPLPPSLDRLIEFVGGIRQSSTPTLSVRPEALIGGGTVTARIANGIARRAELLSPVRLSHPLADLMARYSLAAGDLADLMRWLTLWQELRDEPLPEGYDAADPASGKTSRRDAVAELLRTERRAEDTRALGLVAVIQQALAASGRFVATGAVSAGALAEAYRQGGQQALATALQAGSAPLRGPEVSIVTSPYGAPVPNTTTIQGSLVYRAPEVVAPPAKEEFDIVSPSYLRDRTPPSRPKLPPVRSEPGPEIRPEVQEVHYPRQEPAVAPASGDIPAKETFEDAPAESAPVRTMAPVSASQPAEPKRRDGYVGFPVQTAAAIVGAVGGFLLLKDRFGGDAQDSTDEARPSAPAPFPGIGPLAVAPLGMPAAHPIGVEPSQAAPASGVPTGAAFFPSVVAGLNDGGRASTLPFVRADGSTPAPANPSLPMEKKQDFIVPSVPPQARVGMRGEGVPASGSPHDVERPTALTHTPRGEPRKPFSTGTSDGMAFEGEVDQSPASVPTPRKRAARHAQMYRRIFARGSAVPVADGIPAGEADRESGESVFTSEAPSAVPGDAHPKAVPTIAEALVRKLFVGKGGATVPTLAAPGVALETAGASGEGKPEIPILGSQHGMLTIVAPPLLVATPEAERGGTAVRFDWSALSVGAGLLDVGGMQQLQRTLPKGAQAIYPALPVGSLGPAMMNVRLAPSLLSQFLGEAYGPAAEAHAGRAVSAAASAGIGQAPAVPLTAGIVPTGRPMGAPPSLLPPSAEDPEGGLTRAGEGQAARGGALGFLGVPVRVAPSLGGRSELRDEVAIHDAATNARPSDPVRPQEFSLLRNRLFPGLQSVDAEPDRGAWRKSAPEYGMRDDRPTTVLAPDAGVPPITESSPLPQIARVAPPGQPSIQMPMSRLAATQTPADPGGLMRMGVPGRPAFAGAAPVSVGGLPSLSSSVSAGGQTAGGSVGMGPRPASSSASAGMPFRGGTMAPITPVSPSLHTPIGSGPVGSGPIYGEGASVPMPSAPPSYPGIVANVAPAPDLPMQIASSPSVRPALGTAQSEPSRLAPIREYAAPMDAASSPASAFTPAEFRPPSLLFAPAQAVPDVRNRRGVELQRAKVGGNSATPAGSAESGSKGGEEEGARKAGTRAAEVQTMANEVWALLRRRLSSEAERRGRW